MSTMACVSCHKPPGGRACCPDGQTPMCLVKDGEAHTVCLPISEAVSASPDQLRTAIAEIIVGIAGKDYRGDALANTRFADGIVSYESYDGKIRARAKQVLSASGSSAGLALS